MSFSSPQPRHTAMVNTAIRAVSAPRAVFFITAALLYGLVIIVAALTLNPYFSQTWDVSTFVQAAHRFLDGGNPFDLYAQSRAAQTWPYAYPPLHALVVAAALGLGRLTSFLPEYVWARVPPLLADIGVGALLYSIVGRRANDETIGRVALLLWLFNPVTFYDTAVQGHFESEWLFFVLLAYARFESSEGAAWFLPSAALAAAVLFKQVAILFALPIWALMVMGVPHGEVNAAVERAAHSFSALARRLGHVVSSFGVFGLVALAVCLPYLLYSNDFLYMNLTYVENVPVQTQSWIVALVGIARATGDTSTSGPALLRYETVVTLVAAAIVAFVAARRRLSPYAAAALIALVFFLASKKVMGYYYVMLFPFLFAELLPRRRFWLALVAIAAATWISLSPYSAPWGDPGYWWIYAILGLLNSALFVWMFAKILGLQTAGAVHAHSETGAALAANADSIPQREALRVEQVQTGHTAVEARVTLFVTLGLFAAAALAALLQPVVHSSASPIRAPIITPGSESTVVLAFVLLLALLLAALAILSKATGRPDSLPRAAWGVALISTPLFFAVYCLTKESTAVLEAALKSLGV